MTGWNLHGIVGPIIAAINPFIPASIQFSLGTSTTQPDGTEVPTYSAPVAVSAQVQPLTYRELLQMDGLNLQGTKRGVYLFGDVQSIVRPTNQGGDLITFPGQVGNFPPGTVWLVVIALETWGVGTEGWCKVAVTLQDGG